MDPKAALDSVLRAIARDEWEEARDAAEDLIEWLERGGAYPGELDQCMEILSEDPNRFEKSLERALTAVTNLDRQGTVDYLLAAQARREEGGLSSGLFQCLQVTRPSGRSRARKNPQRWRRRERRARRAVRRNPSSKGEPDLAGETLNRVVKGTTEVRPTVTHRGAQVTLDVPIEPCEEYSTFRYGRDAAFVVIQDHREPRIDTFYFEFDEATTDEAWPDDARSETFRGHHQLEEWIAEDWAVMDHREIIQAVYNLE